MAVDDPGAIRNLVLIGHGGVGKTSLAEGILVAGGVTKTPGRSTDGTGNFDTEPEEQARGSSMVTSFHHVEWKKQCVNLIDTPGQGAFVHDTSNALRAG